MAAKKITYENKEDFICLPDVANINKVIASDMNQIKSTVNSHADTLDMHNQGIIPVGTILVWLSDALPSANYLFCNGQTLEKSAYPVLYNALGTKYGGDSTHFKLPNQNYNPENVDASLIPSYNYIIRVR